MNKADVIEAMAPRLGGRAQATAALESLVDVVLREVAAGGTVGITGFGVFESVERAPRTGRNPRTGEAVPIAGTRSARFRPATYFKQVVADPSTLPEEGLAGVRVATHEEVERAGAPATVRRTGTEGEVPRGGRASREGDGSTADATGPDTHRPSDGPRPGGRRVREVTSGAPETVRKAPPGPETEPDAAQAALAGQPAARKDGAGRMLVGGEDITQSMISAKKAQLARARDERARGKKARKGGTKKDRTDSPGKDRAKGTKGTKGTKGKASTKGGSGRGKGTGTKGGAGRKGKKG